MALQISKYCIITDGETQIDGKPVFSDQSRENSRQVSLSEMDQRSLPLRIRDSLCKLMSPYL